MAEENAPTINIGWLVGIAGNQASELRNFEVSIESRQARFPGVYLGVETEL
jgi:hypothetical protein